MKNILISNDDGILARGIRTLIDSLQGLATLYVCAPHTQRSATGHGLSIGEDVYIDFMETPVKGVERAFAVTGLPADCVKMGLGYLEQLGIEIDYIFSGINHGGNLGTDTVYSGTVSAALEGMICGKSGAAFSVCSFRAEHMEYACSLVAPVLRMLPELEKAKGGPVVLNVNTPDLPPEEIKGTLLTGLGRRDYADFLYENFNDEDRTEDKVRFQYRGWPVSQKDTSTDLDAVAHEHGYASITPVHFDLTDRELLAKMREMDLPAFRK